MNEKALRILEYQKIIHLLADKASSSLGKDMALRCTPMTALDEIEEALSNKVSCPIISLEDILYEI